MRDYGVGTLRCLQARESEIRDFAGVALDLLTSAACERRNHNRSERDIPRNMDRDEAVRWLLRAGADPKFFDDHISSGVRGEMDAGKFGPEFRDHEETT